MKIEKNSKRQLSLIFSRLFLLIVFFTLISLPSKVAFAQSNYYWTDSNNSLERTIYSLESFTLTLENSSFYSNNPQTAKYRVISSDSKIIDVSLLTTSDKNKLFYKVTGLSPGTSTIQIRELDYWGYYYTTGTIKIKVLNLNSFSVSCKNSEIFSGDTTQMIAQAIFTGTSNEVVTNQVKWSSSDTNIVTTNSSGLVTAKSPGIVTVTGEFHGRILRNNIIVKSALPNITFELPKDIEAGTSVTSKVTATYSDGTNQNVSSKSTFSSSNTAIATVDANGNVKGVKDGSAAITANFKGKTSTIAINVKPALSNIALELPKDIEAGTSVTLKVTATYLDGTNQNVSSKSTFSSSNTAIASIDATGNVKGIKVGNATITANFKGKTSTTTINVNPALSGIALELPKDIEAGTSVTLKVTATYSNGTNQNVLSKSTFSSSNTSIATVDANGNVKGIKAGTATITANLKGKTSTTIINIKEITNLFISDNTPQLGTDFSFVRVYGEEFTVKVTAMFSDGTQKDVTNEAVYNSSDLSVSSTGLVKVLHSGYSAISASYLGKSYQKTIYSMSNLGVSYIGCQSFTYGLSYKLNVNYTKDLQIIAYYNSRDYNKTLAYDVTKKATYISSAPSIVSVNEYGRITALKKGNATITIRYGSTGVLLCKVIVD
jgi:uncharacterized protein YjdB